MMALAFALGLAAASGPGDSDLPRSLGADETSFLVGPAAAKADEVTLWVGGHLGVTGAYDAEDPNFVIGANFRAKILPWLGAEGTLDFNTRQNYEHNQIHVVQIPFEFAALFYAPLELPVAPYALAGFGFTISDTSYTGGLGGTHDETELNRLFFLGLGVEYELQPNVLLDANLRFVFVQDPPHFQGNSADWIQFTVGVLFKLSK